jgi:hypothetical protein
VEAPAVVELAPHLVPVSIRHARLELEWKVLAVTENWTTPRYHGGRAPQVRRAAERRLLEIAAQRTLDAWLRSPAHQEAQDRAALASDRPAIVALAERLG